MVLVLLKYLILADAGVADAYRNSCVRRESFGGVVAGRSLYRNRITPLSAALLRSWNWRR